MRFAPATNRVDVIGAEIQVSNPSAEATAPSEGQHEQLVRGVGGQVTGYIAILQVPESRVNNDIYRVGDLLFKLVEGLGRRRLDRRAVSSSAGQFVPGGVDVVRAVRCGGELGKQGQLLQDIGGHICHISIRLSLRCRYLTTRHGSRRCRNSQRR